MMENNQENQVNQENQGSDIKGSDKSSSCICKNTLNNGIFKG